MPLPPELRHLTFGVRDALEIAIVAYVLYRVLLLIHGTRAVQMLTGIVVLVVVYALALVGHLTMIAYLLRVLFTYGALAGVIIFQPELRQALAHLGQSRLTRFLRRMGPSEVAEEVVEALERLSQSGMGAIVVVERENGAWRVRRVGIALTSQGVVRFARDDLHSLLPAARRGGDHPGDTVIGAACILPLSQAQISDRSLGTRHRAALGLAEETDALVFVVSEETSTISVAVEGRLIRSVPIAQIRSLLEGRGAPRLGGADVPVTRVGNGGTRAANENGGIRGQGPGDGELTPKARDATR